MKKFLVLVVIIVAVVMSIYCYLFYPQQQMPIAEAVYLETPEYERYRDDCLHPCIRYNERNDMYYMAQSPYYGWNNAIENPLFYTSNDYWSWTSASIIAETPSKGYNSDPCILLIGDSILYVWRECNTPLCDSLGCKNATVGGILVDGCLVEKRVLAVNDASNYDMEQCPIILSRGGQYVDNQCIKLLMYAAWYQYEPERVNKGVAVWSVTSMDELDFKLRDTVAYSSVYTVDKCAQVRIFGRILYLPKPLKHDLWHFDLFEYNGKMYMVSVAEKGDNIMLSATEDGLHFRTYRKPLVNNHYMENYTGYRQYYYKPTAFVKNDSLFLFYTANTKDNPNRNQLFITREAMANVVK